VYLAFGENPKKLFFKNLNVLMGGWDMKRLECFLEDYSWLLKAGIWMLLIVWATQLNGFFVGAYKKEMEAERNRPPRNIELELKLNHEAYDLNEKQINAAREKGALYGPQDYFNDFKAMKKLQYAIIGTEHGYEPFLSNAALMNLQRMSMDNVGKGRTYANEDVSKAAAEFSEWKRSGGSVGDEFHEEVDNLSAREKWLIFFNWFSTLYLRGLLLLPLLFVIRMASRKGILETILADKFRFVYSIILWPLYATKYPYNVIKEIIVAAELRRIGKIFRRFTPEENAVVRQIAENKNFWQWIENFHFANKPIFKRSFVVALVAVVLLKLLAPMVAQADAGHTELIRAGPEISSKCSVGNNTHSIQQMDDHFEGLMVLAASFEFCMKLLTIICFRLKNFHTKDFIAKIEHVPLVGYLFFIGIFFYPEK
jgi:hypothetical protein